MGIWRVLYYFNGEAKNPFTSKIEQNPDFYIENAILESELSTSLSISK